MIAALFVQTGGVYFNLPDVDPWDEKRDARLYAGPWPVVAHPPCSTWGRMAPVSQARYGHKIGEDGGCFSSALMSVRNHGGVLEHPKASIAFKAFGLGKPELGKWLQIGVNEWTTEVYQRNYGHRAQKRTWLLYHGDTEPPPLDWSVPGPSKVWISTDRPRAELKAMGIEQMGKKEASRTPPHFRDLLIHLAQISRRNP